MVDADVLLLKLETQEKAFGKLDERLAGIERAVVEMALQRKDIEYLTMQDAAISKRIDNLYAPDGAITKLQECANACPKKDLTASINSLWGAIGLLVALIGVLKLLE